MHNKQLRQVTVLSKQLQMKKNPHESVGIAPTKTEERVIILFLRFRGNMLYTNLSFIWHDYSQQLSDPFGTCDIQSC